MYNEFCHKIFLDRLSQSCKTHSMTLENEYNIKYESMLDPEKILLPMPFFIVKGILKTGKIVMISAQEVFLTLFTMIVQGKYWTVASRAIYTAHMFHSVVNHYGTPVTGYESFLKPERSVLLFVAEKILEMTIPKYELTFNKTNSTGLEICFPFGRSLMLCSTRSKKGDIDIRVDMKNTGIYETCLAMHDEVNKLHAGLFSKLSAHIKSTEGSLFSIIIATFKRSSFIKLKKSKDEYSHYEKIETKES